jgi:methionyl-tRNA synthetase
MMKTISTTEFLNYEIDEATGRPKKFSKTRGTGIFGDDAINTGIPSEVWRYYLLANRPEQQDTVFLWKDFVAKNNSELLKNLGNFTNRILKFLSSNFDGTVPKYEGDRHADDSKFIDSIYEKFEQLCNLMEDVKIKDSLRTTMAMSTLCNGYMTD